MRISFIAQRRDEILVLEKSSGDRLRINGELFNFNPLEEGDILAEFDMLGNPVSGVVPSDWLDGPVTRVDGEVRLTIRLPYGANPEPWQIDPDPITVEEDGLIDIPVNTTVEIQEVDVEGGVNVITTIRRWHQPVEIEEQFIPTPEEIADVES